MWLGKLGNSSGVDHDRPSSSPPALPGRPRGDRGDAVDGGRRLGLDAKTERQGPGRACCLEPRLRRVLLPAGERAACPDSVDRSAACRRSELGSATPAPPANAARATRRLPPRSPSLGPPRSAPTRSAADAVEPDPRVPPAITFVRLVLLHRQPAEVSPLPPHLPPAHLRLAPRRDLSVSRRSASLRRPPSRAARPDAHRRARLIRCLRHGFRSRILAGRARPSRREE